MNRDIRLERADTGTRWRVIFEDEEIGVFRDPECSAARWLVDNGRASCEDTLRTFRGDTLCLSGAVGWFADRRVDESAGTPRFGKWKPFPVATYRPEMASDQVAATPMPET